MTGLPFNADPWMDHAACRSHPTPDLWFAAPSELVDRKTATDICRTCPVSPECVDLAIRANVDFGIWGGLEPAEIRKLRKRAKL